jgi:hypothetical protein
LAHAEVVTLESVGFAHVIFSGDYAEAVPWLEQATTIARQANARRYIATDHMLMAACRRAQGRTAEAIQLIDEAHEVCKQIGIHFLGASLLAGKAAACTDSEQRARLLQEGEATLGNGGFGMAALMFYPSAIDIAMEDQQWEEALRYAGVLERCMEAEPVAFSNLVIERTRALIALARDGRTPALIDQLASLRDRLRHAGFGSLLPPVDRALSRA